jgi:class 3 adenylate cyclase/tetratricopeptide (TPR) repeat protein
MPACAKCGGSSPEDARFCSLCGAPLEKDAPSSARARKIVTVLFSDVSGFTALAERLDPEPLHQVIGRWFDSADRAIERHGGTVEKHIGDAVMAVFGVPIAHEDDALRAARAALELSATLAELNRELARRWGVELRVHTGVNTGEVVVGDDARGGWSILGDAVNVAQRLESAADAGEALVGEETERLVRGASRLDRVKPLNLKGRASPVPAWRLVAVAPEEEAGSFPGSATPFVGRVRELALLRASFDRVVRERTPGLITVLGAAGIGKSRLLKALSDDVRDEARVVVGRCLPYGESITFWPLTEIARTLAGSADEEALASLITRCDPGAGQAELIADRVARAAGFVNGHVQAEETQWAVRKLLEATAHQQPLVVVVEDIHWAAPTLLDLIEHVATFASGAPLLLVCLARPELLEQRAEWTAVGGERASVISLAPLTAVEAEELLEQLAHHPDRPAGEQADLLAAAEGNPFFLEQMVAMRAEMDDASPAIPPTIQAVLTARIDCLAVAERAILERASIEGRTFHRGALEYLLADEQRPAVDANLNALVGRELIRPGRPDLEGERAFRFSHMLIRDATYTLIPKSHRAHLHERYVRWLEERADRGIGEQAEVSGYHLEQAFRYRVEIEPAARENHLHLALSGGRYLDAAGRAALARDDLPGAVGLLERAAALLPEADPQRGMLLPELGIAVLEIGRLRDAEHVLDSAIEEAAARHDAIAGAHAVVVRLLGRLQADTEPSAREVRERFDSLLAIFQDADDDLGLDRLWRLQALVHWIEGRSAVAEAAWQRAAEHARSAGDDRGRADALLWLASSACFGPLRVEDGIARCEVISAELSGDRRSQAAVLDSLAGLWAMAGDFERARRLLAERNGILAELGRTMHSAVSHQEAFVALACGDAVGAETVLRAGYERLAEMGEKALLATTAVMLARALREQGRLDDAWAFTKIAREAAAGEDLAAQISLRGERALVLASRGALTEATQMSAEAVRLAARTDWLSEHADALLAQAEVLQAAGQPQAAGSAVREAVGLYERKGNRVGVRRARSLPTLRVPA